MKKVEKDYTLITRKTLIEGINFNEDVNGDNYYHVHRDVAENERLKFDGPVHCHYNIKKGARIKAPHGCLIIERDVEDNVRIKAKYYEPRKDNAQPVDQSTLEYKSGIVINGNVGNKVRLESAGPIVIKKEVGNKLFINTRTEFYYKGYIGRYARIVASNVIINYIGDNSVINSSQGIKMDECGKYCTLNSNTIIEAGRIGEESMIFAFSNFNQATVLAKKVGRKTTIKCNGNILLEGEIKDVTINSTMHIQADIIGRQAELTAQGKIIASYRHQSAKLNSKSITPRTYQSNNSGRGLG